MVCRWKTAKEYNGIRLNTLCHTFGKREAEEMVSVCLAVPTAVINDQFSWLNWDRSE